MTAVDADIIDADNWPLFAACRGMDLNLFFPERGQSNEVAKAVCDGCPVTDRCLAEGMVGTARNFGIWGGRSVRERLRIARARRRPVVTEADAPPVTTTSAGRSNGVPTAHDPTLTARSERCPESRSRADRHDRRRTPMTTAKKSADKTTAAKAKSKVSKDGTITCTGTCGETLPETKFPTIRTKDGEYVRRDECRACQESRRAAARDAKAKAKAAKK